MTRKMVLVGTGTRPLYTCETHLESSDPDSSTWCRTPISSLTVIGQTQTLGRNN